MHLHTPVMDLSPGERPRSHPSPPGGRGSTHANGV
jgi:hypothetical protein